MKRLLAIFLIGICCFLYACDGKVISPSAYEPTTTNAHYNLGYAYGKQGKYDLAIASYQKAISINPDMADAH